MKSLVKSLESGFIYGSVVDRFLIPMLHSIVLLFIILAMCFLKFKPVPLIFLSFFVGLYFLLIWYILTDIYSKMMTVTTWYSYFDKNTVRPKFIRKNQLYVFEVRSRDAITDCSSYIFYCECENKLDRYFRFIHFNMFISLLFLGLPFYFKSKNIKFRTIMKETIRGEIIGLSLVNPRDILSYVSVNQQKV